MVHAHVISRINYYNALFYGLPLKLLHKLQLVQSSAARIITRTPTMEHISLVLQYCWLPVTQSIQIFALHNLALSYLSDLLSIYTPS